MNVLSVSVILPSKVQGHDLLKQAEEFQETLIIRVVGSVDTLNRVN